MVKAIFPGTFDPITKGHIDIIQRGSEIFNKITVGVYKESSKNLMFNTKESLADVVGDVLRDPVSGQEAASININVFNKTLTENATTKIKK